VQRGSAFPDALYLQSPKLLKRLSLGYNGLLADIYWTRAVQYFGYQHHEHSTDFHLLAPLLKIAVELDPKLVPAYQFGSNFLSPKPPNGAGEPKKALELATYGVQENPDQWRLYYNLGFLYYTEFKDYARAADAFARGAQLPVTNEFMPILAARMAQHAGEYDTAKMLWFTTYQSTKEPQIQKNAVDHLKALRVDEDVTQLQKLVERYSRDHGHLPKSVSDLETAGYIRGTPIDPNGHPYRLMADGRIEVESPDTLLYITKGLPPGMEPPQPKSNAK
jgi:tetratricopeptide (TPR) repeat protein